MIKKYAYPYNGDSTHAIILWTGSIVCYNASGSMTYDSVIKHPSVSSIYVSFKDGLVTMTLSPVNGASIYIQTINVTMKGSSDADQNSSTTSIQNRGNGSHWFSVFHNGNKVYIREFHNENDKNDTWHSTTWANTLINANVVIFGWANWSEHNL